MYTHGVRIMQDDIRLAAEAVATEPGHLQVVRTSPKQHALELWEAICLPRGTADGPLLLMTEEYEMLDSLQGPEVLAELLQVQHFPQISCCAFFIVQKCICLANIKPELRHVTCLQPRLWLIRQVG